MNKIVKINNELCIGCGKCVSLCPKQILLIDNNNKCIVTNESKCDRLGGCQRVCPTDAIEIH